MITLITQIKMPTPEESKASPNKQMEVFAKVKEYLDDIDSGCQTSTYQWEYIKTLYTKLTKKPKLSETELNLLDFIAPIIHKYTEYDGDFAATVDFSGLHRKSLESKE